MLDIHTQNWMAVVFFCFIKLLVKSICTVPSPLNFKSLLKSKLRYHLIQSCNNDVQSLSKCLIINYRLYKLEFVFEDYVNLPCWQLSLEVHHELPIEKGRFLNIERNLRIYIYTLYMYFMWVKPTWWRISLSLLLFTFC
jgi:hypothetical protein